jgi:cyclic-di-GMP-binding biofilm dispersal mediator protein
VGSPRSLDGAVVAVLGASGGLGRPLCAGLEARGARVIRANRSGGNGVDVVLDLRDADAGTALVAAAVERYGRLDGVINATGIVAFGDLLDTDDVVIEELFLTNVLGPLWLAKRVAPTLAEHGGFLVNISGVVAETPMPGMVPYSASKAALAGAAVGLRRELRRRKVHVLDVRPPHTETGLATRPLAGTAPGMPPGLDPDVVVERILAAVEAGEDELPSSAFG